MCSIVLLTSCKKSENKPADATTDIYQVVPEYSKVAWVGSMDNQSNTGSFNIEGDGLKVKNGEIQLGSFTIPIISLNVINLEGDGKAMLETHLKSGDFFNLLIYPTAKFSITSVEPYTQVGKEGVVAGANHLIKGDFTLLGKMRRIEFPAKITIAGDMLNVLANLKINRLDYGMTYASDPTAAGHYIYPEVDLVLGLMAKK